MYMSKGISLRCRPSFDFETCADTLADYIPSELDPLHILFMDLRDWLQSAEDAGRWNRYLAAVSEGMESLLDLDGRWRVPVSADAPGVNGISSSVAQPISSTLSSSSTASSSASTGSSSCSSIRAARTASELTALRETKRTSHMAQDSLHDRGISRLMYPDELDSDPHWLDQAVAMSSYGYDDHGYY